MRIGGFSDQEVGAFTLQSTFIWGFLGSSFPGWPFSGWRIVGFQIPSFKVSPGIGGVLSSETGEFSSPRGSDVSADFLLYTCFTTQA